MKPRQWEVKNMGPSQGVYDLSQPMDAAAWLQKQPDNRREDYAGWLRKRNWRNPEFAERFNRLLGEED